MKETLLLFVLILVFVIFPLWFAIRSTTKRKEEKPNIMDKIVGWTFLLCFMALPIVVVLAVILAVFFL